MRPREAEGVGRGLGEKIDAHHYLDTADGGKVQLHLLELGGR